jgi:hypothetical protein
MGENREVDYSRILAYPGACSKTNAIDPGLDCQVFADRGM